MANCTYTFTGGTSIKGIPALKAFLLEGGLDTYLPERAMEMQGPSASARAQPLTPADVLKPKTIAKAEAAIAQYKKAEPPDPLTTKQRADGEQLLEPMFEAARRNKAEFDATLDRIGESVNGYAKKPAIKKSYRSVTKLVLENEGDAESMKDLLRGTIVVNSLEDVQDVIDEIGEVYGFDRIKNRLLISVTNTKGEAVEGKPLPTGYQDVLTNVVLPDGTIAEIQISTPEMVAAKSLGHQIFSFEREMPESPVKSRMVEIQKQIYAEGLAAYERRAANALKTLSNSASSTGSPFSRTSEGLRGLGSGTQAVAERQFGETVTGTSFQSKNMVPGGRDLKSNFIRTSDPIIPDSRAYARKLDSYISSRNKSLDLVSSQSIQNQDIETSVAAFEAALLELENGSKDVLPVPIGRIPHVLSMLRQPTQMLKIDTSIIKKVFLEKHAEEFNSITPRQLILAIYQPAMVLKSKTAGEFEIVTSVITPKGPVIVPIQIDSQTVGGAKSSSVKSIYGKKVSLGGDSILQRMKDGALVYADPEQAQVAVTGRGSVTPIGVNTSEAQFSDARPIEVQDSSLADSVKPLNPYFVGWSQARNIILDGIANQKVKSDVDLMKWIGNNFKGETDAPSFSRREQKNAAASRVEGTSEDRFKRTPALQQAVVDLQEGKITQGEYNRMVDELRPVYPYKEVPAVTTPKDARYALENGRGQSPDKAAQYGVPAMTLKTGDWAQLRLDIPSYQLHDTWVVTVHTPKSTNREVQAAYDAGPRVGYESVAAMTDVTFGMNQKAAAKIAAGSSKGTIATMLGKWSPISKADAKARAEAAMKDKSWTQVGMDPFRHSYFYDRDSMRPVLSADEVIQIGPLVLAKNAQFGEDTDITGAQIAFSARQTDTPAFKKWFGDSEVVDDAGKPMVVYHSTPENFSVFDTARSELGSHFGPVEQANAFGGSNGRRIMPVYLSIKKPIRLVDYGQWDAANTWGQLVDLGVVEDKGDKISDSLVGMATGGSGDKVVQDALIKAGYDGIVYLNRREGFDPFGPDGVDGNELDEMTDEEVMDYFPEAQDSYIVFKPTQIKSAIGNTGAFDPNDPDISYSPRQFRSAQGQRFTLQDETYTKTVQRNLQDYFARVADVQDALSAQGGVVGEAQNVYLAEELSYGRLQEQMVDFKEDMLKPLIKATKAAGLELSDLALYAYAKHAPERNQAISARNKTFGKGEGSGMTTSEANNIMRAFKADGKDQDLAALHAQLMQITQVTRLVLLSEGLITQDQFDALQRQYSDYVPLRGFVEDEDLESGRPVSGPRVGGRGFNIRGKETMRALGRESRAGHVIENIVIDYERAIARSERNTVAKVFLDLATTNPDPGLWEIDTVRTKAAFDRATGMVKYNTLIDKGEDTISVKIEGKEIYIKIKDPLLLRAMRAAGKDETGAIDRVLAMSVGRYTALMRNTLTRYNPAFGFTNAVKDLGFGAVSALSDLGPKGTALFFKNYANPVQSGQMFEEFRAAGATTGGWHIRDQQEMQKELQRLVEWEGGSSIKSTAYSMGKATLDALEFIGQYSETQARFAAYKAARQLNKSPAEAASIAKNLTTNFNRKGEWGSAMNTMYLFFNAGVQGSVKTIKNLRSPYVMAAMAGLSGLAAGLAFMGAGVGGDDDDGEAYWDKIPQFEKERNLILMLPPGEGMMIKGETKVGKNGRYFKLPIQYGINVFSTLGYQIADLARYTLDHSRGVSPAKAATNMVSVTFGSFNPFGGGFNPSKPAEVALAVSPSIVDLGVQALMGVNSFGTPVAPRKYDDIKPDAENFGPGMAGTWEQRMARWLSESTGGDRAVGGAIDVSPGSIRNIVRNLTGGTGDFLTSVFVNIPSKMWSPEGEVGPRDVPVLKAFYGEVDEVTDSKLFYERKAEVLEAAKQAADRQKLGIEVDYDDESRGLQSLGKSAKSYTKKMTELRKKELKVAEDSSLTETQKKADRKDIQKERAQIASEFNALYYEMKKDLARK